jgi:hypothetical protein
MECGPAGDFAHANLAAFDISAADAKVVRLELAYLPAFDPLSTHHAIPRSEDGVSEETRAHCGLASCQGKKQMLRRVFPFLKRLDVEFTLECVSFILFCAAFLH